MNSENAEKPTRSYYGAVFMAAATFTGVLGATNAAHAAFMQVPAVGGCQLGTLSDINNEGIGNTNGNPVYCPFVYTSAFPETSVTGVSVDFNTTGTGANAELCARRFDGSFAACSAAVSVPNGNGSWQTALFDANHNASALALWTGDSSNGRYAYVRVVPQGTFNGVSIVNPN